ncbi:hypothetical protein PybrP1_006913 [[Pythium] brassicae (nom. inval.)]|nr:hypothetical protein PybrP1_006913 [[Pythium] brassicae (nom. inval.)]
MSGSNNQEPFAMNRGYFERMIHSAPFVVDSANSTGSYSWPSFGRSATKNIIEEFGKSCFKEFAYPTVDGSGNIIAWRQSVNGGFTLQESNTSSGMTCPIMLSSSPVGSLFEGRLVTDSVLTVAYGAINNALSNPLIEGSALMVYHSTKVRLIVPRVQIGGDNVFNSSNNYDFSSFREEISNIGAIKGDLGNCLNCGLLDEQQWSNANRFLIADCSLVSGISASAQGCDLLLLIVYERELELDVLTGEIYRTD